ncbi:hypothetical protein LCGC14_0476510 [marine sediment metagenome]|uniref:LamG-like jellyroll fold domain-containing protein n=1 Tax=marine sediment metagenome TaxID=412755 RepID=A0A0F9VJE6_9ZZZZ
MKKIMLLIFCMVFLVGTVSAFEFDNKLTYSNEDLKVDFINLFGFGKNYGSAELKSHSSVNEIKQIGAGNQVVMYYDFNFTELYSNGLGDVEFIDVKTREIIDRDYNFVYWGTAQRDVYTESCNQLGNKTLVCDNILSGTENYETWLPYISRDIPIGNIRIGLQTNVEIGDRIDGIWTIIGKQVSRHAEWIASLNSGLVQYFKFTEEVFTNVVNDSTVTTNGTNFGATTTAKGIIGNAYQLTATTESINTSVLLPETADFTINFWFNQTEDTLKRAIGQGCPDDTGARFCFQVDNTQINAFFQNNPQNLTFSVDATDGIMHMITLKRDSNNFSLFYDGDFRVSAGSSGAISQLRPLKFGSDTGGSTGHIGNVDEFGQWNRSLTNAEIETNLWNGGLGNTFTNQFGAEITNIFPANNSILTSGILNVTADVDGSGSLINVSIFVDGTLNQTNTSTLNTNYSFDLTLSDKVYNVVWEAYNSIERTQVHNRFTIDTTAPQNMNITSPFGFVPYQVSGETLKINWNVSDINIDTCRILLNDINTTVTCADNTTTIVVTNSSAQEIVLYANDSVGNSGTTNRTFTYSAFQNAIFFNSSSFETKQETFTINITTNNTAPQDVELIYNGTTFTGGVATNIAGNNYNLSRTIGVLSGTGNKTFNFNFTLGGKEIQGTDNQQSIAATLFGACNGTLTVPYINFTFRNETLAQENVNATFTSTWVYSLGLLSDASKSFSFTSATENQNYTFCGIPSERTININVNLTYNNDISQQRSFSLTTALTNVTATQILFLLPTALGIFSPFKTATITGDTITDVKAVITRILGGSLIDVTSGFTDGSGFISFFLDPDETYTATFSKTGFADNTFSFVPAADTRTVVMGTGVAVIGNGTTIARGLLYNITPINGTLANNTDVNFTLFVSSNETITLMSLNITNSTNTQLLFASQSSQGLISGIANTGNQTRLIGTYIIQTATETITVKRIWIVSIEFEGDYSIYRQLTLFTTYGFSDFMRILMVIFSISAIMIFLTRREVIDTSESKVIVATLLIWAFSLVGWLDTGLVSSTDSSGINRLSQLSNQFGVAIISTGVSTFFVLRRVFIRRI